MEPLLPYLLKSGSVLALFLSSYQLFLKKETFFVSNRFFLVMGLVSSLVVPFITFTRTVFVEPKPFTVGNSKPSEIIFTTTQAAQPFNWLGLLAFIYALGIVFFSFRLLLQLWALQKIKKDADVIKRDNLTHIKTEREISPFSFFKYIFYNPQLFKRSDLKIILSHEKVHATQLHSLDILLSEIVLIFQWFNPIIWLYRKSIKENLEYQADAYTCIEKEGKKHYQYLLLQKAIGANKVTIANPFFNSLIKKRIVMLNQNQSKKVNLLKLFIVLPFVVVFLLAFNVREEVKFSEAVNLAPEEKTEFIDFQSPLNQEDIKRISSHFGMGQNKLEKDKFHNGIDLVAAIGTKVLASNSGTVLVSSESPSNGNYIIVKHNSNYSTKYMHLKDRSVKSGEQVEIGAVIGDVGNTGKSTGPHLHFEILKSDKPINPESLVAFKKNSSTKSVKKQDFSFGKIELTIDKDTTNEELEKIKNDLEKDRIDFSYMVVHNDNQEIIDISVQISGKNKNGGAFNNRYNSSEKDEAIAPLVILIDSEHNLVSIGSKGTAKPKVISIDSDDNQVWISSDAEEHKEILIKEENGKKIITVNGKEVSEEELQDMEIHMDHSSSVFIQSNSDDEHDVKVVSQEGNSSFFIDTEGKSPLFIVDGKESSSKKVKRLDPNDIENIDVSKGEAAIKKYGKKAKDGVVEITTKRTKKTLFCHQIRSTQTDLKKSVFFVSENEIIKNGSFYDENSLANLKNIKNTATIL